MVLYCQLKLFSFVEISVYWCIYLIHSVPRTLFYDEDGLINNKGLLIKSKSVSVYISVTYDIQNDKFVW